MSTFLNMIKDKCISFEYFGIGDSATEIEIKEIIENQVFYRTMLDECKQIEGIGTMEDYYKYFICLKYSQFQELVPMLAKDEFKKIINDFSIEASTAVQKINNGEVIKFINTNINEIFESKVEVIGIEEVTLNYIEKFKNGISEEAYKWLVFHYDYLLLDRFESFETIFEKYPYLFEQIFKTGHYEEVRSLREETVFDIFSRVYRKEKSPLKKTVDRVVPILVEDIFQLCSKATKDNVFFIERTVRRFIKCLNDIKSSYVNQFVEPLKTIELLLNESVKENGYHSKYEIPMGEIINLWKKQKEWEKRFISLTHDWLVKYDGKIKFKSRLEVDTNGKNGFLDEICSNSNSDDYYTRSLQDKLNIVSAIETATILSIMQDEGMYSELIGMLMSVMDFISNRFNCGIENFEKDIKILDKHLQMSMQANDYDADTQIALCYGASMFICALIDKLMKSLYLYVVGVEKYISIDKVTLGQTLNPNDTFMRAYLGEKHIRHLAYFLSKDGERERVIGYNHRNSLAHWTINPDSVSISLVGQLMWLFIDVVNTIFTKLLFAK